MSGIDTPFRPGLVLHVGRNKAGSTTIQDFCAARADWLAAHGVTYALLGHLAGSVPGLPSFDTHHGLADFARRAGGCVFASNEMLAAFPPALIADVARGLAGLDVQILLYVRPYRAWLLSCYGYEVRCGRHGADFDAFFDRNLAGVSIWPAARAWGEALGWDRVRVRSTLPEDLAGGDLVLDCLAALGLPPPPYDTPAHSNVGPHWMALELLRLAVGRDQAEGWDFQGRAVAEALHERADEAIHAGARQDEQASYLRPDQARRLADCYNRDIQRLRDVTGISLATDDAAAGGERPFLPSAAHVPADIVRRIAEAARQPDAATLHPELAAFVRSPGFAGLPALAPPRPPAYVAGEVVPGPAGPGETPMRADQAEIVEQPAAAAFRLAAQGDYAAAIEHGMRAVRDRPDAELLSAMAVWRRDAFGRMTHPAGPAVWPPSLPDPFPGVAGIPAIEASALTAEILGGAILHHGSLRVNGLVKPDVVERLKAGIDRAIAAQDEANAGRPDADGNWYSPLDVPSLTKARQWSQGCGAVWTADSPPMLEAVIGALRECGVLDAIAGLMGERPALSVAKSTLRRVQPTGGHDWHQDGAFLGRDVRSVNVWLALSNCGSTAPGMDVVGSRLPYILQTHSHGAYFDWSVGQGMVDILAEGGAPVLTPEFGPGDALLFDHMMLHRTSVKPGMTGTRWAIESWFFAPTCYPYDQIPLLV
jgi:hypothetical protein